MQEKMRTAVKHLQMRKYAAGDIEAIADIEADMDEDESVALLQEVKGKVTPDDLFTALVEENGNGVLKMEDFEGMFKMMDLSLTEAQRDRLFAYCDEDCSGEVTEVEFAAGWDRIMHAFLDNAIDAVGVSEWQIVSTVLMVVAMIGLLITFILFTISAWSTADTFSSVVQTSLVSACGMLGTSLRRKSKAEAENTEGLVGDLLAKQEEDAGSGEGTVDG